MVDEVRLQGADVETVRAAVRTGRPFTGDAGFAGALPDGRLVRDVLGRYPLFVEEANEGWAFARTDLASPRPVPPGSLVEDGDERSIWSIPSPNPFPNDSAAIDAIDGALRRRCKRLSTDGLAIGFSGGVDSSLLAAHLNGPLFTVGFPGQADLTTAEMAAESMGRDGHYIELAHDDLTRALPTVVAATGRTNAMDVAIALSIHLLATGVREAGYERVVLGQGADELFGGYEKVAALDHRIAADTVTGARNELLAGIASELERDVLAVRSAGVEPVMPFLGDGVVAAALRLHGDHLVRGPQRKWALRRTADRHLSTDIAWEGKRAMQYGSGVATELDRLARQAGYKRRQPGHVERYIRAVLESSGDSTV